VWIEPDVCDPMPEGSSGPPAEGATGRLAYVDEFGQVSPTSAGVPIQ
jgi:hypothetical protein